METSQHLAIIRKGVEYWNKWREENEVTPNLEGVDLRNANLPDIDLKKANLKNAVFSNANLWGADMLEANLEGANLERASLAGARLVYANLKGARFFNANLKEAFLSESNLENANFTYANLLEAYLQNSNLRKASIEKAILARANLEGADLSHANLYYSSLIDSNLSHAKLKNANLSKANLANANLANANLLNANLNEANLTETNFEGANLKGANLEGANLRRANLKGTNLSNSNLQETFCIEANFNNAILKNARVYGVSAWNIQVEDLHQNALIITKVGEPTVTVDNIEVAQFIYLILNNQKLRDVIGTMAKKGVLILGRFTPERKVILDAIREKLREYDLVPIIFDFERAASRDFTETIKILAGMSRFVIADITNPKSSPLELQATIPDYMIPFVPIIQEGEMPFSMFVNLQDKYKWVLPTLTYGSKAGLLKGFQKGIIKKALDMDKILNKKKNAPPPKMKRIEDT